MSEAMFVRGSLRACCADPANLDESTPNAAHPDATVRTCRVCGRRHYRLKADPATLVLRRPE